MGEGVLNGGGVLNGFLNGEVLNGFLNGGLNGSYH